jgi:methionyl-tRNA formyltransferase
LPWNKGADPNLWSFLENTPKGVTIHYLDEGIDTGDILAQKEVQMRDDDTLKTSYERLSTEIEQLFEFVWPKIKNGQLKAIPQPKGGSFHRLRDKKAFEHLLTNEWDTQVANLIGKAL